MMRKRWFVFLSILLIAVSVHSAVSYQREAEILHQIGLFQGTDEGFELGKAFTRAEGATMLVRLLGKEEEALSSVKKRGDSVGLCSFLESKNKSNKKGENQNEKNN